MKKLYLSEKNKKVWGVLGGVGETYDIDPTLIRILFVLIMVFSAFLPAILFYFLAWLVIPSRSK